MKNLVILGVKIAALVIATAPVPSRSTTHVARTRGENGLLRIDTTIRGNCAKVDSELCKITDKGAMQYCTEICCEKIYKGTRKCSITILESKGCNALKDRICGQVPVYTTFTSALVAKTTSPTPIIEATPTRSSTNSLTSLALVSSTTPPPTSPPPISTTPTPEQFFSFLALLSNITAIAKAGN